ncbi:trichohyalin-like [Penaeus japonicus]|uniref:trichohyalin-like n=1 Tax=Penaeus japonicus TaxID=27405 RepID=UPI001C70D972|nr:trichohyalin-like [Penaeus japonicus]
MEIGRSLAETQPWVTWKAWRRDCASVQTAAGTRGPDREVGQENMRPDWSVCRGKLRMSARRSVSQSTVKPRTMRNYLDEARELGLRGMQVLHYIEQQEKIRREKEERAYQEREEQRQEAEKRRHEARKQRKSRTSAEEAAISREQEERALEERQRQKKDAQKAQQKDGGTALVLGSRAGQLRNSREKSHRSEEPPATKHSSGGSSARAKTCRSSILRRPNGQEQRTPGRPTGEAASLNGPATAECSPSDGGFMGKVRAQEAQSAETKAPVKAWAPEEPRQRLVHQRSSQQKRVHRRSRYRAVCAPEESPAEARAPEEPSPETLASMEPLPETDVCTGGAAPRTRALEELPQTRVHVEEAPPETCAPEEPLAAEEPPTMARTSGENDDLADSLPGIGRPLEEAIDVKCSPREPSRMRCTSEDPPVGSRSPEELLAEKESFPEEVFPAQLP